MCAATVSEAIDAVKERITRGRVEGRAPLFILGGGISAHRVPLLSDLGNWFFSRLNGTDLPDNLNWTKVCAKNLANGDTSRRDAADFFSLMQSDTLPFKNIWTNFSHSFLRRGFRVDGWRKRFPGIRSAQLEPSKAHKILANAVGNARAPAKLFVNPNPAPASDWLECGNVSVSLEANSRLTRT